MEARLTLDDWNAAIAPFHEEFYDLLVGKAECGAFDGGCVVVAEALHQVVGGAIHVVMDREGRAQHAVVLVDGALWDYDGPRAPTTLIDEFDKVEMLGGRCVGHRPMLDGDLPEAYRDDALRQGLAEILRNALGPSLVAAETPTGP